MKVKVVWRGIVLMDAAAKTSMPTISEVSKGTLHIFFKYILGVHIDRTAVSR